MKTRVAHAIVSDTVVSTCICETLGAHCTVVDAYRVFTDLACDNVSLYSEARIVAVGTLGHCEI